MHTPVPSAAFDVAAAADERQRRELGAPHPRRTGRGREPGNFASMTRQETRPTHVASPGIHGG